MISALFGQPRRRAGVWDDSWFVDSYAGGRYRTQAGVVVDEDLALTYAAVWCATRIITEGIANLPLHLDRIDPAHVPEAVDHRSNVLAGQWPNPLMPSCVFRQGRTMHQVNWGNGFAEIEREQVGNPSSPVTSLWPIHPSRVRPVTDDDDLKRGYRYLVRNNDSSEIRLFPDEMLHIPGALSEDGVWGKGVISHARESVGFGIATERHGATQFGAGNLPKVALIADGLRDPDARRQFRNEWRDIHGHPDSAEIAIIPKDGTLQQLNFSNEDSQFLGSRQHNTVVIAQWYKLPPYVLAHLLGAIKANVEQQSIELVIYGLMPWAILWEGELAQKLLTPEERTRFVFRHDFKGLLRGDFKSRMDAYRVGLECGALTHNMIARLEGYPELGPAGDQHFVPANWTTVERVYKGEPPPGAKPKGESNGKGGASSSRKETGDEPDRQLLRVPTGVSADADRPPLRERDDSRVHARAAEALHAAQAVLADVVRRLSTKEANAALRAAKGDFDQWLEEFYPRHEELLAEALAPVCLVLKAAGHDRDPAELATFLCAVSKRTLLGAYNSDTPTAFAERLGKWPAARAEEVVLGFLGE